MKKKNNYIPLIVSFVLIVLISIGGVFFFSSNFRNENGFSYDPPFSWDQITKGKASKSSCVLASRVEAETDEELEELFSLWKMTKSDENYNRILRKYEIIDSGSLEGALNYYEGFGYMPYEGSTKSEYAIVTYYYFFSSKGKLIFKLTDWGTAEKISVDLGDDVSTYVYIP